MESATWLLRLKNATAALSAHPRTSQICDIRNSRVNGRQPSGLNKNNLDCGISLFSGGGGLMQGIKIPQQDFGLKMQGVGYAREGGHICGTYS